MNFITKFIRIAKAVIAPPKCVFCRETMPIEERTLCDNCEDDFIDLTQAECSNCGEQKYLCKCSKYSNIKNVDFLFWYSDKRVKTLIGNLKYRGDFRDFELIADFLAETIKSNYALRAEKLPDGICYVPRLYKTIINVGYDQSYTLASMLGERLHLPIVHALKRMGKRGEQKKLSGEERRLNVKNKYKVRNESLIDGSGKMFSSLLLVDDVITTGSTISECAYMLHASGIKKINVAAAAKTPFHYKKKNIVEGTI